MNRREFLNGLLAVPLIAWAVTWVDRLFPEPPYEEWPLGFTDILVSDSLHTVDTATSPVWGYVTEVDAAASTITVQWVG